MKLEKWNIPISFFALIISVLGLFCNYYQDNKINKIEYILNSIEYQPILKKVDNPEILSYKLILPNPVDPSKINTIFINELKIRLEIVNTGKCTANIIGELCADINKGDAFIRDLLLGKNTTGNLVVSRSPDFFDYKQILPNEKKVFEFTTNISDITNDTFVKHFLILYTNDANTLYDSYFWMKFSIKSVDLENKNKKHDSKFSIGFDSSHAQHFVIDLIDTNFMSYIYKEKEAKNILEQHDIFFDSLSIFPLTLSKYDKSSIEGKEGRSSHSSL